MLTTPQTQNPRETIRDLPPVNSQPDSPFATGHTFVAVWETGGNIINRRITGWHFSADVTAVDSQFFINVTDEGTERLPDLAPLAKGECL